jgi:hypothetical protein
MSRAYRIRIRESLKRVVRAQDHVQVQLEVLGILPAEEMADLLAEELLRRGFERKGQTLVRRVKGLTLTVEPATGTVTVDAQTTEKVELETEREARVYDDWNPKHNRRVEKAMREEARQQLDQQAQERATKLQEKATERLEAALGDLRQELDQVSNRVTAEALKRKAAQMGRIKEMTEDQQSGSLTIVLEV